MKKLSMLAVVGLTLAGLTGCGYAPLEDDFGATPAYSSKERYAQIDRNWDYEGKQIMDDIDSALLLRPASRLTIWHVR